jgi:hypothetical protein
MLLLPAIGLTRGDRADTRVNLWQAELSELPARAVSYRFAGFI